MPAVHASMTLVEAKHRPALLRTLLLGLLAGLLAGVAMLLTMAALRLFFGWPTPTEMIFDRLFPKLTVKFFIGSLVKAGGYTPLKLQGVYGALAGQLIVAGFGGMVYAWWVERAGRRPGAGWRLLLPGVVAATLLFVILLWPQLLTNYAGLPPALARWVAGLAMLISFGVCGAAIAGFYALLAPKPASVTAPGAPGAAPRLPLATTRRRFVALGTGAGLAVLLNGVLRRLYELGTFSYDGRQYGGPQVQRITPIRPQDKFYQVSKNLVDPKVNRDAWRLDIIGQVENPRSWSFAELAAMPSVTQESTLLCISYGVGSGLCSNAVWKGVSVPTLLAQVKPKPNVTTVLFHAADGYYETFRFEKLTEPTTLVAYEMNGEPLPPGHGFPIRLIVPGLYGEKNPKWLTRLELLNEEDGRLHRTHGCGFYKEQGWGQFGDRVPIHSRFDAPQVFGDHFAEPFKLGQPTELRGMALSGDRGISRVELSFDDGKSWTEAPITQPGTKIAWSLWSLVWTPAQPGEATLLVRAVDGEGNRQIEQFRDQVPNGATGLHRVRATVQAA